MRFQLYTLIDITETGARKGDNEKKQKQQQNFLTVVQTISLRCNPIINHKPIIKNVAVDQFQFGSAVSGVHQVWTLDFEFETEAHSLELLEHDFDLVPVISELDETINLKTSAFFTKDTESKNIIFKKKD